MTVNTKGNATRGYTPRRGLAVAMLPERERAARQNGQHMPRPIAWPRLDTRPTTPTADDTGKHGTARPKAAVLAWLLN